MSPPSKRKSDATYPTSAKKSTADIQRSVEQSELKKHSHPRDESVDKLFKTYANKSLKVIDPEGIEALCKDIGIDHTDVRILMLAWKMKAQKQGFFTKREWKRGLKNLNAHSVEKLKRKLTELEEEAKTPEIIEDFYVFAFQYCLTEEKQKCVDIENCCALLNIVLRSHYPSQVDNFVEFLSTQTEYKVMNEDQWLNFLRFCTEINFPGLENYDILQAWHTILDNFAEWMNEKKNTLCSSKMKNSISSDICSNM